jgi:hypothetical protein
MTSRYIHIKARAHRAAAKAVAKLVKRTDREGGVLRMFLSEHSGSVRNHLTTARQPDSAQYLCW